MEAIIKLHSQRPLEERLKFFVEGKKETDQLLATLYKTNKDHYDQNIENYNFRRDWYIE